MDMPQLVFLAVVGVIAYAGYRKLISDAGKVTARIQRREKEQRAGSHGTLVRDPKTGVYKPAED